MLPGSPHPLGATWDGDGVNFAVFSAHAEKMEVCVFDNGGTRELQRLALPECTDEIWHGYLPQARPGTVYGLRAHGPYDPEAGQRFNPHKLLLDPYARRMVGALRWSDALYGFDPDSPHADLSFDVRDSAAFMPKAVIVDPAIEAFEDAAPRVPWGDTVIYEAHLRGLTLLREDLPAQIRGSFAALGHPRVVDYLLKLGIAAVELLPIHACAHERTQLAAGRCNYWGYNTLAWFAVEPRYLASGELDEMRAAIAQLHAAGIEVILDVVYNHSGEGGALGPTLSLRGLDNRSYYRLVPEEQRRYVDATGCGNTVNLANPNVLRLVMDSLRYWVEHFHVDGFRFDLCSVLAREDDGFDPGSGFLDALRQDPLLARTKLIAEPWDQGPGGYQLGRYPPGFAEWNDRFRDDVRRFWRGDEGLLGALAERLHGSGDRFDHHKRRPWASVNFVAAHDGFTLRDLVSYTAKRNLANGEDDRDGASENWSHHWGAEGHTQDAAILDQRGRIQRALLTTLFCAQGTPMILAGDEFGRTQDGNNNAWCQDNHVSWMDWSLLDTAAGRALHAYVQRLIALRRAHPSLRGERYLHGRHEPAEGIADIAWFDREGLAMSAAGWHDAQARCIALRRASRISDKSAEVSLLLINGSSLAQDFRLPEPVLDWVLRLNSAEAEAKQGAIVQGALPVAAHAVVLLLAETEASP